MTRHLKPLSLLYSVWTHRHYKQHRYNIHILTYLTVLLTARHITCTNRNTSMNSSYSIEHALLVFWLPIVPAVLPVRNIFELSMCYIVWYSEQSSASVFIVTHVTVSPNPNPASSHLLKWRVSRLVNTSPPSLSRMGGATLAKWKAVSMATLYFMFASPRAFWKV